MAKQNNNAKQRALFVGPLAPVRNTSKSPNFAVSSIKQMAKDAAVSAATAYIADKMGISPDGNYTTGGGIPPSNRGNNSKGKGNNKQQPSNGDIVVFKGNKNIGETNTSYALSKAPNPKKINLNTGIKPNVFSIDYQTPVENACAPLHMSGLTMQIPTATTNPLYTYFINNTCFDIQTRAQANSAFSLDIVNKLSGAQIVTAINAVINALQIYFYYSSILSYESDPRNKNAGMIALRSTIDAQTLSDLSQLGRRLQDTPCPPRVVEWIRYMNGNFLSGMSQGAPLLKFFYQPNQLLTTAVSPSYASTALASLNLDANTTVFTLIRKAIPQWRIGKLYDCPPTPTYDSNFLSIFSNAQSVQRTAGANVIPNSVASNDTAIPYVTYTNRLDGLAFSMGGIFNTVNGDYYPGLARPFSPNATYPDTRYSYYSVSGVKAFYPVNAYTFLALSRADASTNVAGVNYGIHLFGTDKCQQASGNAFLQSAQNTLDFLFDTAAIPLKGTVASFNGPYM